MGFDIENSGAIRNITPEEFAIFRDFICDKIGIKVREGRVDYLEYRVQQRMIANSIADYREYYYMLKYESASSGEFQKLINLMTVHETSFFRHRDQLESLRNLVLKDIIKKKREKADRRLKLWSAACATGEEPLTLAMILKEDFPELTDWSVSIMATDLSTGAIDKAMTGVYGENSFRDPDIHKYRTKYFRKAVDGYHVLKEIRDMVTYRNVNLTDLKSLELYQGMDVILCRNVFIYFPDEVQEMISQKLYDLLNKGGVLMLGNAESINVKKVPFRMEFHKGGAAYIKA